MDLLDAQNMDAALAQITDLAVEYSFSVLGAIITLIAGFVLAGILKKWTYRGLGKFRHIDETLKRFLSNLVRYGVLIVVGVVVLGQFGIETTSIIAVLGAAGLAIGLALQGTLQNIAAGLMLLFLRPVKAGEYVEVGNVKGTIEEIGLFATQLKTLDGLYLFAPNQELWNAPVTNYSRYKTRRNDLVIGIGYDDDIASAQKIMMEHDGNDSRVLNDPEPISFVSELGDSAVSVAVRYWTATSDWFAAKNDLNRELKLAFDKAGISIPYPQQDIHVLDVPKGK